MYLYFDIGIYTYMGILYYTFQEYYMSNNVDSVFIHVNRINHDIASHVYNYSHANYYNNANH